MKTTAIICEYNPFHNGHKYQIDTIKNLTQSDGIICLMSGNFVQRGEFAVFPKEIRAKAALAGGADLILENPAHFVLRSAEGYAESAVYTLSKLGCVDYLAFGGETDNLDLLKEIAEFLCEEPAEYKKILKNTLDSGKSYPTARAIAVKEILGDDAKDALSTPNNLLGVEYLKAIYRQNSKITPILIPRKGTDHDSTKTDGIFASATNIRNIITQKANQLNISLSSADNKAVFEVNDYIPSSAADIYKNAPIFFNNASNKAIHAALCMMSADRIYECGDITEGLENRIKQEALKQENLFDTVDAIKSKRYTHSRIRRIILRAYLGMEQSVSNKMPSYAKILDFNQTGQKILNKCKTTSSITLAKNASPIKKDIYAINLWKSELEYDKVYKILSKSMF